LEEPPPPSRRKHRWSLAESVLSQSAQSSSWFDGTSTPSSEASFEVGRASDWLNMYGRTLNTPPATSQRNSLGNPILTPTSLRQLTLLTPSPSPRPSSPGRRFRRPLSKQLTTTSASPTQCDPPAMARTISESMILAAGLSSQRERRRGLVV
jgi:hypothetical protein